MGAKDDQLMLVAVDASGKGFDMPGVHAAGRSGATVTPLGRSECIPLPKGSEIFQLPGRIPIGFDAQWGEPVEVGQGEVTAAAAFLAPAHTQLLTAAYETAPGAPRLPLFAYTALGWHRGRFYVPARRVDPDRRQDIDQFPPKRIAERAGRLKERHRRNRLWQHLLDCALCSGCPAARNLVMGRWEAPLPISRTCNARCLGCLSLQPPGSSCPATQERISFTPTVDEILEIPVPHLESAPRAVVSFGQGCEGEPLTQTRLIEEAVHQIRRRTSRGTINMNTNASSPQKIERLFAAGLDSIRVSLNSAREEVYSAYFRPIRYSLGEVEKSLLLARRLRRFASINYFVFPGVTDDADEFRAFTGLLTACRPGLIQWRNLNLDPEWYWEMAMPYSSGRMLGVGTVMDRTAKRFPALRHGYYNPPLRGSMAYASRRRERRGP
jgi:pyruvate-formate lyase-activating enzyme